MCVVQGVSPPRGRALRRVVRVRGLAVLRNEAHGGEEMGSGVVSAVQSAEYHTYHSQRALVDSVALGTVDIGSVFGSLQPLLTPAATNELAIRGGRRTGRRLRLCT